MKTFSKEWSITAPWGKIALVSWGNPSGEPVLLVHGRQDSAATFLPLAAHLPDTFNYVAMDMPGNGRSDPFPIGVKLTRYHFIAAVEAVVKHLNWDQFVYIGHSMGCEQGLFFNIIHPHRIKRLVLLDFGPSLQRLQVHNPQEYYGTFYRAYYENYDRDNFKTKLYSRSDAVQAVMRARGLTEEQANVILSRNMVEVGHGKYRLSWDMRLKYPAPQNYPPEYYYKLFSINLPPTLLISATDETSNPYTKGKEDATLILNMLEQTLQDFKIITVKGDHDVHFTNPNILADYVIEFLKVGAKSKL